MVVGRVGRAHGLDGSVYLEGGGGLVPLEPGTPVELDGAAAVVEARKGTEERPILRFDVATDRTAARALRGREVTVAPELLPEPEGDLYLHVDLVGCRVVCAGEQLGEVRSVAEYPANDVLEVAGADGVRLVPFVADVVVRVDVPERLIVLRDDFL